MRLLKRLFPAALLAALIAAPATGAELVDRIIAVVNDEVITFSDLNREGGPLFRRIAKEAPQPQIRASLLQAQEGILSSLIDKMIVEQRAKKLGISASEAEIDEAVARTIARSKGGAEQFRQQLVAMGTNEQDYRSVIKSQILQDRLIDYEIRSRVVINDERIREYYEKNYTAKAKEEAYHILQMGFAWQDQTPKAKEEARQRAEKTHGLAAAGQDFRSLARQYSDLPSAQDGGDLGTFKKEELSAQLKASIANLRPGQISPVQETPAGFQFVKLLSDRGDVRHQASYETVKEEIRQILLKEALNSQFQKWVQELRDEAYIKKLL